MARLGELLVASGLLTTEQIDQALRAQVMWGARLGTNLIELGFLDLDQLSTALGHQHGMPAALARHFEKVDRELQQLLSPDVAHKLTCVPLVRVGAERKVVIASCSPLTAKGLAIVADELCVDPRVIIPSIAAELRMRYQLERIYGIHRPSRFMRSPGENRQSFHNLEIEVADSDVDIQPYRELDDLSIDVDLGHVEQLDDDDLTLEPTRERAPTEVEDHPAGALALDDLPPSDLADDLAVPTLVEEDNSSGKERRKYARTLADGPVDRQSMPIPIIPVGSGPIPTAGALGRIAIRRVKKTVGAPDDGNTLGEATRAIRRATDRDTVAALVIEALFRFAPSCHAATMLVVRGGIATSWRGFCRSGGPEAEVVVPLDQPGLVPRASRHNSTMRAPMSELGPIDQLLLLSLGATGELCVVPVSISGQVLCVIAMVTEIGAQLGTAESIAVAAGAAFARLMRDASR
ncbi:MAG: hypothetical protein ABI175_22125 [Polyangiales bacterium]